MPRELGKQDGKRKIFRGENRMCKGMKTWVLGGSVSSSEWLDKVLELERTVQRCQPRLTGRLKVRGALDGELRSFDSILQALSSH